MCPSSGLWGGVLDSDSYFAILSILSFDGHQLWHFISVWSSLYLLTRAHCAWCSPSIPLWLDSHLLAPAGGRTESPDCALRIPVSYDRRRFCLCFLLLNKLCASELEVAFKNRSVVTQHEVHLLKFPLVISSFERTDNAFVLLICFCFFHL